MRSILKMIQERPQLFRAASDVSPGMHAEKLDQELGVLVPEIEGKLLERARALGPEGDHHSWGALIHQGNQTWVGLSHQTLQTPYTELEEMCHLLRPLPGETVVDLGAGYGRLGLVLAGHYPEVNFIGFEYVKERVTEGSRILEVYQCPRASLIQQDLTDESFSLPLADYYLIYDYGTVAHIRQTLKKLEELSGRKKFKVIGRGKGTRSLIQYEHPWLADVFDPIHRENFSIYSMSGN